jgi:hypothetical protein
MTDMDPRNLDIASDIAHKKSQLLIGFEGVDHENSHY